MQRGPIGPLRMPARALNWPDFTPPQRPEFAPPLTHLAKSATGPSKINATALRASISSSRPSSIGIRSISATPLPNCAPMANGSVTIYLSISRRSAGSILRSTATTFGRPRSYNTPSGPSETRGSSCSMPLSVRSWEDSTMTSGLALQSQLSH